MSICSSGRTARSRRSSSSAPAICRSFACSLAICWWIVSRSGANDERDTAEGLSLFEARAVEALSAAPVRCVEEGESDARASAGFAGNSCRRFRPDVAVAPAPDGTLYGRLRCDVRWGPPRLIRLDSSSSASQPFEIEGAFRVCGAGCRCSGSGSCGRHRGCSIRRDTRARSEPTSNSRSAISPPTDVRVWLLVETAEGAIELLHIDCGLSSRTALCRARRQARAARRSGGDSSFCCERWKRLSESARVLSSGIADRHCAAGRRRAHQRYEAAHRGLGPQTFKVSVASRSVLDGAGDTVDGPLTIPPAAVLAVRRDAVWFAADTGLWRIGAADDQDARESDSTILTPALLSPDSDPTRGWLRAEVLVDLPRGAVLDAEFATTDKPDIAAQAIQIAGDRSTTAEQEQDAIWQLFTHPSERHFRFTAPVNGDDQPIAIPLFESTVLAN